MILVSEFSTMEGVNSAKTFSHIKWITAADISAAAAKFINVEDHALTVVGGSLTTMGSDVNISAPKKR
jgi:hypothetical protein